MISYPRQALETPIGTKKVIPTDLKFNVNGSLDLYIENENPGPPRQLWRKPFSTGLAKVGNPLSVDPGYLREGRLRGRKSRSKCEAE